jgi:hypothetical protein
MSEYISRRLFHVSWFVEAGLLVHSYPLHGAAQESFSFDPSDEVTYRYERAF